MKTFCRIYADSTSEVEELIKHISQASGGTIFKTTVNSSIASYTVMKNSFHNSLDKIQFPDGFTFFRFSIEVDSSSENFSDDYVNEISNVLRMLWTNKIAAVASCDFENMLPNNGGYKSSMVPWVI